MRRVLATATLGLALLGMAACADQEVPEAGASGAPAATSAAPAAPPMDKAAACAAYEKAEKDASAKLTTLIVSLDAIKSDPAKAQQAMTDLSKAFADFEAGLTPVAAGAADPELKAAVEADVAVLKALPAQLAAAGADVDKVMAIFGKPEFTSAGEKVKSLCGK
jgi:hypothetical protein